MSTAADPNTARRVVVRGTVQGVSFRYYCALEALRLGVAGWVRNEPDGTVSAYFEGPAPAVAGLLDWCREGPPGARVYSLDEEPVDPLGAAGFNIG